MANAVLFLQLGLKQLQVIDELNSNSQATVFSMHKELVAR